MEELTQWLNERVNEMETVREILPSDNKGAIEAEAMKVAYENVLQKIASIKIKEKQEPASGATETSH